MENRVYYGEYSLSHWLDLMLKKNVVLPEYQRYFVWNEDKAIALIDAFKAKQFVPPITIGSFNNHEDNINLILDGQQRLTSVLLAYLGIFPDQKAYKTAVEKFANENDDQDEDDGQLDNVYEWTFHALINRGKTKESILANLIPGNYKQVNYKVDAEFFKTTFLGFSYLVPRSDDEKLQQKFYSSVFRNINVQGISLLPQESRESLYFLDKTLAGYFSPRFMSSFKIASGGRGYKIDFVKYLSLLSQYANDGTEAGVAKGYKTQMEKYYEEYIYSVVGEISSGLFKEFPSIFPGKQYEPRMQILERSINELNVPHEYASIIDVDLHLFGLIYSTVFRGKSISVSHKNEIEDCIRQKITYFKYDPGHAKAPASLKYLRSRIYESISIFKRFESA